MVLFTSFLIDEVIIELGLNVLAIVFGVLKKLLCFSVVQWLVTISFTLLIDVLYVKFEHFPT